MPARCSCGCHGQKLHDAFQNLSKQFQCDIPDQKTPARSCRGSRSRELRVMEQTRPVCDQSSLVLEDCTARLPLCQTRDRPRRQEPGSMTNLHADVPRLPSSHQLVTPAPHRQQIGRLLRPWLQLGAQPADQLLDPRVVHIVQVVLAPHFRDDGVLVHDLVQPAI